MAAEKDQVNIRHPLVSICIPAYNQTRFLRRTLESISEQTFRDFEVVITDDSTNDDVEKLVSGFRGLFICSYQRNPRQLGSPANWNAALGIAQGRLIKMMHHDDWFARNDALEKMVAPFLHADEPAMSFCASEIRHIDTGETSFNRMDETFRSALAADPRVLYRFNLVGAPSATLFPRTQERFDEKLQYLVDVDFYIRLLRANRRFVYLDEALIVNTASHAGQVTAMSKTQRIQIGEYLYLYDKLYGKKIPSLSLTKFFVNLFDVYGLQKLGQVKSWGYNIPEVKWYFSGLLLLSRFKRYWRRRRRGKP